METAVRKATRLDYNPPKQKHLSTLVSLTYQSPGNAASIIDLLDKRLRENSWIIIFKVLITIHTLMRLGDGEKTIAYVETKPSALDTSRLREKSSGVVHIQNIYLYTAYLEQKVIAYRHLKYDYVKRTMGNKEGRLRRLPVKDGLLKETIVLQKQIGTLLKCNFILDDVDNNISLYAFRLLVEDLLVLFQVINESIVNILEHYFAMDKPDARTSLEIYKRFARQTEDTISFFNRAKSLQHELDISIPSVKHAPLSLATALQEYLDDLSKTEVKKNQEQMNNNFVQPTNNNNNNNSNSSNNSNTFQPLNTNQPQPINTNQQPKELIDFFASLENEKINIFYNPVIQQQQQPMFSPVAMQPTGHNPFRTNDNSSNMMMTTVPQPSVSMLPQQTGTANPFRSNTMPQMSTSAPALPYYNNTNFQSMGSATMMQPNIQPTPSMSSNNPFAITSTPSQPPNTIMVSSPISTTNHNPFSNTGPKHQQLQSWGSTLF